jgi:hypothetical protein
VARECLLEELFPVVSGHGSTPMADLKIGH